MITLAAGAVKPNALPRRPGHLDTSHASDKCFWIDGGRQPRDGGQRSPGPDRQCMEPRDVIGRCPRDNGAYPRRVRPGVGWNGRGSCSQAVPAGPLPLPSSNASPIRADSSTNLGQDRGVEHVVLLGAREFLTMNVYTDPSLLDVAGAPGALPESSRADAEEGEDERKVRAR